MAVRGTRPRNDVIYVLRRKTSSPPFHRRIVVGSHEQFQAALKRHADNILWAGIYHLVEVVKEDERRGE